MNEARSNSDWKVHVYGQIPSYANPDSCVMLQWYKVNVKMWQHGNSLPQCHAISDVSWSLIHPFFTLSSTPLQPWLWEVQFPSAQWSAVTQFLGQRTRQEWNHSKLPKGAANLGDHSLRSTLMIRAGDAPSTAQDQTFYKSLGWLPAPREFRSALYCQAMVCCLVFAPCLL